MQRSPRRQENVYTEPIFIQNIIRNIKNKEEPMYLENQNNQNNPAQNFSDDSNTGKISQHSKKS